MDGLSADKLRIFLHPIEMETKPKKKMNENETSSSEETAVTTLSSIADKREQVRKNPLSISSTFTRRFFAWRSQKRKRHRHDSTVFYVLLGSALIKTAFKMLGKFTQMSISPIFYKHFFVQKCFAKLFSTHILALKFFGWKKIGAKAARKIWLKLTTGQKKTFFRFKGRLNSGRKGRVKQWQILTGLLKKRSNEKSSKGRLKDWVILLKNRYCVFGVHLEWKKFKIETKHFCFFNLRI